MHTAYTIYYLPYQYSWWLTQKKFIWYSSFGLDPWDIFAGADFNQKTCTGSILVKFLRWLKFTGHDSC